MSITEGRIMQLALARLESLRETLDSQIAELRSEIRGSKTQSKAANTEALNSSDGDATGAVAKPRRRMTLEQRNAISEKMKIRWAERKQAVNGNVVMDPERLKPRLIKANRPAMMS